MSNSTNSQSPWSMVITDIDGVLTDGGMYYGEQGDELKKFNVRDGAGVALFRAAGYSIGAISGESVHLVQRRLEKLKFDFFHLGISNKRKCLQTVLEAYSLSSDQVVYIGDELNDEPLLGQVGLFLTPADGCDYIREHADAVLPVAGGQGVLRAAAEYVLKQQGQYQQAIATYVGSLCKSPIRQGGSHNEE